MSQVPFLSAAIVQRTVGYLSWKACRCPRKGISAWALGLIFSVGTLGWSADPTAPTTATLDWNALYAQAHQYSKISPLITAGLFRQIADNADTELADRALLQLANLQQISMMEPRQALHTYEEFLARLTAKKHPSYSSAATSMQSLKSSLTKIDALEAKLSSGTLTTDDKGTTGVLCSIADIYRGPLDTPKYAFMAYKRAFDLTSGTFDLSYYMMGNMKMDQGELAQAVTIFDDFQQRFPQSNYFESAVDLSYRCQYLQVFYNTNPLAQTTQARELISKIDKALADHPRLDPVIQQRLRILQELMQTNILSQTPEKPH
jgi:hypothetical protein